MSAGSDVTGVQTKQDAGQFATSLDQLLKRLDAWIERIDDVGWAAIQAAYQQVYGGSDPDAATKAQQDVADLQAFVATVQQIAGFVTYTSAALTAVDNTPAGGAAQTATIPAGSYAVISADPGLIALLRALGSDKSPTIRKLAPLKVI